ncbi:protein EMBRYO DEFECTIVE 514-like isoform X2 [Diospyros lotus]|uniref:protein EMBRYO DEFECTIVE 514-like isoform X2 n=1 Tax=Diospyros lotus TaxID=55363 RepID=UPI00224F4EE9|nr:protein EMBRYO DEFECTIVE 514-like isoform X2 [Diospyros lotus]
MAEPSSATESTKTLLDKPSAQEDMDLVTPGPAAQESNGGDANTKLARDEEGGTEGKEEEEEETVKKQKVEKSSEEDRLEKLKGEEDKQKDGDSSQVSLGPKCFGSSVEMFDYFYKFLHYWTPNVNVNKYEHMMLLELLKKGHPEPEKKIGCGILAFQVRYHPQYRSRCFFLVRNDESVDDFSFRKCVDRIDPLPENMQIKSGGGKRGRGGGRGGGWAKSRK